MTRIGVLVAAMAGVLLCVTAVAPAQTLTSQPADRLTCGDWQVDVGITSVQLAEDQEGWGKVYLQLREDVDKLLTEEQRTKRDTPIQVQ